MRPRVPMIPSSGLFGRVLLSKSYTHTYTYIYTYIDIDMHVYIYIHIWESDQHPEPDSGDRTNAQTGRRRPHAVDNLGGDTLEISHHQR